MVSLSFAEVFSASLSVTFVKLCVKKIRTLANFGNPSLNKKLKNKQNKMVQLMNSSLIIHTAHGLRFK
jgi:hypothetical protein